MTTANNAEGNAACDCDQKKLDRSDKGDRLPRLFHGFTPVPITEISDDQLVGIGFARQHPRI